MSACCERGTGGLEHVDVAFLYQFGIELEEECYQQQSDMHSVDIGIGSDDNLVVTKIVESVLNIEGSLEEVELLILVTHASLSDRSSSAAYRGARTRPACSRHGSW